MTSSPGRMLRRLRACRFGRRFRKRSHELCALAVAVYMGVTLLIPSCVRVNFEPPYHGDLEGDASTDARVEAATRTDGAEDGTAPDGDFARRELTLADGVPADGAVADRPVWEAAPADQLLPDAPGNVQPSWVRAFGSSLADYVRSVAVDASGKITITGSFRDTVDFGGGSLISAGADDIFVASFTPAGLHRWSKRLGGGGNDAASCVAVDASGNVIVTGSFDSRVDFGGRELIAAGGGDVFVASYTADGVHRWSKGFGSTSGLAEHGRGVAVDDSGNVALTGRFYNTANFGGADLISAGAFDAFVASYTADGVHRWSKRLGGVVNDGGWGVAAGGGGAVVVIGAFGETVDFGGGDLVSAGADDIFVASYSSTGGHNWSKGFGGVLADTGRGATIDGSGNITVTGYYEGTVNFGGVDLVSAGGEDIFVASYTPAGVHRWSRRFGGTSDDHSFGIAVDSSGNSFLTGEFRGPVDFGGGSLSGPHLGDIFVASYSSTGGHRWSRGFSATSSGSGQGVAVAHDGTVTLAGIFLGTLDIGGTQLSSAGDRDMFLLSLAP